jgi:hypothetical protein
MEQKSNMLTKLTSMADKNMSVFSTSVNYGVVKITHFSFEVVLQITEHTMIYLGSGPSKEIIALHPAV